MKWKFRRISSATRGKLSQAKMSVDIPSKEMYVEEMWDFLKVKLVDTEQISWKVEEGRDKVEPLLLKWCELHFSQTRDTPLSSREWRRRMDPGNSEDETEEILSGRCPRLETDREELRELMTEMLRPEGVAPIEASLEFDNFVNFVRKQQESNQSSPSGRHYVHLKTCQMDPYILQVLFDIMDMALRN